MHLVQRVGHGIKDGANWFYNKGSKVSDKVIGKAEEVLGDPAPHHLLWISLVVIAVIVATTIYINTSRDFSILTLEDGKKSILVDAARYGSDSKIAMNVCAGFLLPPTALFFTRCIAHVTKGDPEIPE